MKISSDPTRNFSTFLAARLIFVAVPLGVAAVFRSGTGSAGIYLFLFGVNVTLCLSAWEISRRLPIRTFFSLLVFSAAVVLDTAVLYYTGGTDGPYIFLYFFSVGSAGLLTGLAVSTWAALASTAGLIWLFFNQSPHFLSENILRVFVYGVNLVITGILTSYVHQKVRERERKHQRVLGELAQTRLDTQAILDSLGTGVLVVGNSRQILYSNPALHKILGISSDSASTREIAPEGHPCLMELMDGIEHHTQSGTRMEVAWPAENGDCKPVGFGVSPLKDASGERRGFIILCADLTESRAAEKRERERERLAAIGRLSEDLAHEIRNPLAAVRGSVEMIHLGQDASSEQRRYLELALRESDRLNRLLQDFLVFAHLDSPRRERRDLMEFIRNRIPSEIKGIPVRICSGGPLEISFDVEQIGLVVDALLLSLAEWAEGSREIRIEIPAGEPERIQILLAGQEISHERLKRAFEPFSRITQKGSGLTLATALRAVHAHDGSLTLQSERDTGTWFELTL